MFGMDEPKRRAPNKRMPAYESLNARERTLLEADIAGVPPSEAGKLAGYSAETTTKYWHRAKRKPAYREAMRECFEAIGLDAEGIAGRLKTGIDSAMQYQATKDGMVVELGPDWHARFKGLDMVAKIAGAYPDPRDQQGANVQVVVINPENSMAAASPFNAPIVESPNVRELGSGET